MRYLPLLGLSAATLLLVACDRYPHPWDDYHKETLSPDVAPTPVHQPAPIAVAPPPPPLVGGVELFRESEQARITSPPAASTEYAGAKGAVCTCAPAPPLDQSSAAAPSSEQSGGAPGEHTKKPTTGGREKPSPAPRRR